MPCPRPRVMAPVRALPPPAPARESGSSPTSKKPNWLAWRKASLDEQEFAAMADTPASLKPIKPYLERGQELKARDPVVAYHCRLFALQEGMAMRAKVPKSDMGLSLIHI